MSPASLKLEDTTHMPDTSKLSDASEIAHNTRGAKRRAQKRKVCFTGETKTERTEGHTVMAHAPKRHQIDNSDEDLPDLTLNKQHPFGVKPLGNMYLSEDRCIRKEGLGAFATLGDELFIQFLGGLRAEDLAKLSTVSRAMYVYTSHDALWRPLVFEKFGGTFRFRNSWKQTYLDMSREAAHRRCPTTTSTTTITTTTSIKGTSTKIETKMDMQDAITSYTTIKPISIKGLYSDELFQPWFCAAMGVEPSWLTAENIPRVSNLSLEDFIEKYEIPNLPVIITDVVRSWPASTKWSEEYLCNKYGDVKFRAGPIDITLRDYYRIKDTDENPIYVFDKFFGTNAPGLVDDYVVPPYFSGSQDLFSLFGDKSRPDYKWIIIGPAGSGSTFHIDPNATSAWNGVVKGRKKWIMYPPSVPPPGIFPSEDGSEVAAPVSLNEWFSKFYAESKKDGVKPFECICNEGEMVFVPSGWWHAVLNIEDSIAITQNYVSNANLVKVLDFLENKSDQVSGCKASLPAEKLYARFTQEYNKVHPEKLKTLCEEDRLLREARAKGSFWSQVKKAIPVDSEGLESSSTGGFSFGF